MDTDISRHMYYMFQKMREWIQILVVGIYSSLQHYKYYSKKGPKKNKLGKESFILKPREKDRR